VRITIIEVIFLSLPSNLIITNIDSKLNTQKEIFGNIISRLVENTKIIMKNSLWKMIILIKNT